MTTQLLCVREMSILTSTLECALHVLEYVTFLEAVVQRPVEVFCTIWFAFSCNLSNNVSDVLYIVLISNSVFTFSL